MHDDASLAHAAKRRGRAGPSADGDASAAGEPSEAAGTVHYLGVEFEDFDASAELSPYDTETFKLSRGAFRGRWSSASSSSATIVLWSADCALYNCVGVPEGWFGLSVSLGPPGARANGMELDRNHVVMSGPGSELETDFPAEGAKVLFLAYKCGNLDASVCGGTSARESVLQRGIVSTVRTNMASGLTESALALLGILGRVAPHAAAENSIATLFAATVEGLQLESDLDRDRGGKQCKPSLATFTTARQALLSMEKYDAAALAAAVGRSPRAIQLAFAEHARTTPCRYLTSLRLNRARTALLADSADRTLTICQVAEAHGFLDWSGFTRAYRQQFGETPSQTRARRRPPARRPTA